MTNFDRAMLPFDRHKAHQANGTPGTLFNYRIGNQGGVSGFCRDPASRGFNARWAGACKPGPVAIVGCLRIGIKQVGGMAVGIQRNQTAILSNKLFPWQHGGPLPVRHNIADGLTIKIYFRHGFPPVAKQKIVIAPAISPSKRHPVISYAKQKTSSPSILN